jgi:hypothetical protein
VCGRAQNDESRSPIPRLSMLKMTKFWIGRGDNCHDPVAIDVAKRRTGPELVDLEAAETLGFLKKCEEFIFSSGQFRSTRLKPGPPDEAERNERQRLGSEGGQPTDLMAKSFSDLQGSIRVLVSLLRHRYIARLCRAESGSGKSCARCLLFDKFI